jgi:hypothetical protein
MKKLAITMSLLAGATAGYSQGVINWSDYAPAAGGLPAFYMEVFSPGPGGNEQNLGNTANDLPPGGATYSGVQLGGSGTGTGATGYGNGANYDIGLYVSTTPSGVQNEVSGGTPIAVDNFSAGSGGWDFSGGLSAVVPGLASGTAVYVELAAWYSGGGATSYAAAIAAAVPAGTSSTSSGTTLLGGGGSPPAVPGTLAGIGITDFSLATTVPEPNTIALGVIGASTFLMRLRRKK